MPTSVLLAVLVAAGLLALAPALVRRYDATERLVAERALSTARVLSRNRRKRTVPGRRPVNPPSWLTAPLPHPHDDHVPHRLRLVHPDERAEPRLRHVRHRPAVYRRRRVLSALVLLNVVQLAGLALLGPGFLISLGVTAAVSLFYLVHLRGQAIQQQRKRRAEQRQAEWLAEQQAAVRRAQQRRAEARREAARLLQAELQRAQEALAALAALEEQQREQAPVPPRVATLSYRAAGARVRGRAYEVGPAA